MDDKKEVNVENNSQEQLDVNIEQPQESAQTVENPESVQEPAQKLEPQIIGEITTEKQKGVFGMILIFVILIGFTFGLPQITKYYNEKNAPVEETKTEDDSKKNEEQPAEVVTPVYYEINTNADFTVDTLHFSALTKEQTDDYYLRMTIENRANKIFDFSENYYIELYNSDKTLLERVKLVNTQPIASNNSLTVDLPISENSFNTATLLTVSVKTETDYQEVSLTTKEEDFDILKCTNKNRNITYYFSEDKLVKINDVYEYSNEDATAYATILRSYTNQTAKYNNIEGVSSNIVDTTQAFTMNTQIDLEKANINSLGSNYYFKKDTTPKVVKFEMESMRYTCN